MALTKYEKWVTLALASGLSGKPVLAFEIIEDVTYRDAIFGLVFDLFRAGNLLAHL